jgi:hypothetical protein
VKNDTEKNDSFLHSLKLMKYSLLLLASLVVGSAKAQSLAGRRAMDEKYGFRDVRFETDSTAIPGIKHAFDAGVRRFYTRPTDKLRIGDGELEALYYVFVSGKLSEVVLSMDGTTNANAVYGALKAEYGTPNVMGSEHAGVWNSSSSLITYDRRPGGKVDVHFSSKAMEKVRREATKDAGKKAASDL